MILDIVSLSAGTIFIALMITAFWASRGGSRATLRGLTLAVRLYCAALAAEVVSLVAHLLDIPEDGLMSPAMGVLTLVITGFALRAARKSRDLKGEQVTAEAERTVRQWAGGA